jgi:hypothetical protein
MPTFEWKINLKTVSESNSSEHWSKKAKRHKNQKKAIWFELLTKKSGIQLPCIIKLSRVAPRLLDDDNLVSSFKWIRDAIAEEITGIQIAGRADDTPMIKWQYAQEKGLPKEYAIKIEILSSTSL